MLWSIMFVSVCIELTSCQQLHEQHHA